MVTSLSELNLSQRKSFLTYNFGFGKNKKKVQISKCLLWKVFAFEAKNKSSTYRMNSQENWFWKYFSIQILNAEYYSIEQNKYNRYPQFVVRSTTFVMTSTIFYLKIFHHSYIVFENSFALFVMMVCFFTKTKMFSCPCFFLFESSLSRVVHSLAKKSNNWEWNAVRRRQCWGIQQCNMEMNECL